MKTYVDKSHPLYNKLPVNPMPMTATMEDILASKLEPSMTIKFDGEFVYVIKDKGQVYLLNKHKYGRIRTDCPITDELNPRMSDGSIFMGELIHGNGKDFHDFQCNKFSDDLNLMIFGSIRDKQLSSFVTPANLPHVRVVPSHFFYGKPKVEAIKANIDWVFSAGYEGVVLTDGVKYAKVKKKKDADLVMLGYESETARVKDLSLLLGYKTDTGYKPLCFCANGLSDNDKIILKELAQDFVIGHDKNVKLVKPELIITVEHQGLLIDKQNNITSIRMPVFKDFRFDKDTPDDEEKLRREASVSMPRRITKDASLLDTSLYRVSYLDLMLKDTSRVLINDPQSKWYNDATLYTFYKVTSERRSKSYETCICNRNCDPCDYKFKCVFEDV